MSFQTIVMFTVDGLANLINHSLQDELETSPDFDRHLVTDEELLDLLLSLIEDIWELVVTLAEEQGREVLMKLEETKAGVTRLVTRLVMEYPRRMAGMMIIRLLPAWLSLLRTVSSSALRSGNIYMVVSITMELITFMQNINNNSREDVISRLQQIKKKTNAEKLRR